MVWWSIFQACSKKQKKMNAKEKVSAVLTFFFSFSEQNMVLVICVELTAYMRV